MSVIRPVQPCDIAAVREALVASWHATYDPILGARSGRGRLTDAWHAPQTLAGEIDLPDGAFLLAEDGGRVGRLRFWRGSMMPERSACGGSICCPKRRGPGSVRAF